MAILMFTARKHDLIDRIYRKQDRLQELTRKLSDLQQYSASIADGSVSMFDLMNCPASMVQRTLMFMNCSHNMAVQNSQMNYTQMMPMLTQIDPQQQMFYQQWMMQSLYKQEREKFAKMETQLLNQQEKEIMQEKEKLESSLKMDEAELESVKKAEEKGIEQFRPNYVGS